jgi:hypothetical protein
MPHDSVYKLVVREHDLPRKDSAPTNYVGKAGGVRSRPASRNVSQQPLILLMCKTSNRSMNARAFTGARRVTVPSDGAATIQGTLADFSVNRRTHH